MPEDIKNAQESLTDKLKSDIETFQKSTGMKFSTIGFKAISNGRMWEKLQAGGTITLENADKLYDWMAKQGHRFNQTKGL